MAIAIHYQIAYQKPNNKTHFERTMNYEEDMGEVIVVGKYQTYTDYDKEEEEEEIDYSKGWKRKF
jgi:hypothetical protein